MCVCVQVRAVAREAAALRDAEKQLAGAEAAKVSKEAQLVKAKEAQVSVVVDPAPWHQVCPAPT